LTKNQREIVQFKKYIGRETVKCNCGSDEFYQLNNDGKVECVTCGEIKVLFIGGTCK